MLLCIFMKKAQKRNFIDIVLLLFAAYLLFTTNWADVDKFSQLLLLMYALCVVLRISNIMKAKRKELAIKEKQKEQIEQEQNVQLTENSAQQPQQNVNLQKQTKE